MPRKPSTESPVRLLRAALEKTQPAFAKIIGVSTPYLQKIELGKRPITAELVDLLVAAYGVTPDSISRAPGQPRHVLEDEQHSDLVQNIRLWQTATEPLGNWATGELHDFLLPKLEVLLEAAGRHKRGTALKHQKPVAIMLRLDRVIDEIVDAFGLTQQVRQVQSERETAGEPVTWERQLVIKTAGDRDVRVPSRSKIHLELVRSKRKSP